MLARLYMIVSDRVGCAFRSGPHPTALCTTTLSHRMGGGLDSWLSCRTIQFRSLSLARYCLRKRPRLHSSCRALRFLTT